MDTAAVELEQARLGRARKVAESGDLTQVLAGKVLGSRMDTTVSEELVLGEGGHNLLWQGKQQHLVLHSDGQKPRWFRFDEGGDDVWESDVSYYSQGHI